MSIGYKNIYIGNLFSSNADNHKSNCYDRIIKYLGKDNLYWALVFCFTVTTNEDYKTIKKCLNRTRIDILLDYHEQLQKKLEESNYDIGFTSFIEKIDIIRTMALRFAYNEARILNEEISKLDDYKKKEAYNLLISSLEDKSNPNIENAIMKFSQEARKLITTDQEELEKVILLEIQKIPEYILNRCRDDYRKFNRQQGVNQRLVIAAYENDSKRRLCNPKRSNLRRSGKSLVRSRRG